MADAIRIIARQLSLDERDVLRAVTELALKSDKPTLPASPRSS